MIPTSLYAINGTNVQYDDHNSLVVSRTISILLLLLYILYLFFELRTHWPLFDLEVEGSDDGRDEQGTVTADVDSLGPTVAMLLLITSLALIVFCARALISSFDGITGHTKKVFIGFILFPFLGNVTDLIGACTVAWKNQMDITILVTLGSSMQILLFTMPSLVILGWIIQVPLTLQFGLFEASVAFVAIIVINYVVMNGRGDYLKGAMCIGL